MTTMKNSDLMRFYRGLLMYGGLPESLPSKLTYAVNNNRKKFKNLAESYDETIQKLQEDHAARDDKGKKVWIGPNQLKLKDQEAYFIAQKEIDDIEVETPDIFMVSFALIPDMFNGMVHTLIDPMIQEPERSEAETPGHPRVVGQG